MSIVQAYFAATALMGVMLGMAVHSWIIRFMEWRDRRK